MSDVRLRSVYPAVMSLALLTGCSTFGSDDSSSDASPDNQVASTQDVVPDDATTTESPDVEEIVLPRCIYTLDPLNRYTVRTTYPRVVAGTGMSVVGYDVKAIPALTSSQLEQEDPEVIAALAEIEPVESEIEPLPQVDLELEFGYYELFAWMTVEGQDGGIMSGSSVQQRVACTTAEDYAVSIK